MTLTLFSIPKPFRGEAAVHQRNAIGSWARLRPRCEILLLGDDAGVADAARESGARHVPGIRTNELGTPLLDDAFDAARREASGELLAYVNADVVLLSDFPAAARRVPFPAFLMAGSRFDLPLDRPLDFAAPDWEERLRGELGASGTAHHPLGSDYFVFPRAVRFGLPPFAVGRPGWDNWMIWRARALRIPVVDASAAVAAVHPVHGYRHVPEGTGALWEGPEAERNRELIGGRGGWDRVFVLADATHRLLPDRLARADTDDHLRWRVERFAERHPGRPASARLLAWLFARRELLPGPLWRRLLYALC